MGARVILSLSTHGRQLIHGRFLGKNFSRVREVVRHVPVERDGNAIVANFICFSPCLLDENFTRVGKQGNTMENGEACPSHPLLINLTPVILLEIVL